MEYTRYRLDPRLAEILGRLHETSLGQALADRVTSLATDAEPTPSGPALVEALRAPQWLLDRASDGGIPLTSAGYLKPADVRSFAAVLPTMDDWIFDITYEIHARPVLGFREFMQRTGLLRKYKGALMPSRAGRVARTDPEMLWDHLAAGLIPAKPAFDETATILTVLHFATSPADRDSTGSIVSALGELGWAHAKGVPVDRSDVQWVVNDAWNAIGGIGPSVAGGPFDRNPSPPAVSLVRDALLRQVPLDSGPPGN